jgi:hypothetical protein
MVSIDRVERGVVSYLDSEIMSKLPVDGWRKVAAGTGLTILIRRGRQMLEQYKTNPILNGTGIMSQSGDIDLDALSDALKQNIPEQGFRVVVPALGTLTFVKSDVDALKTHIMNS